MPQDAAHGLVGFHVCCPRCGFVSLAVEGDDHLRITEGPLAMSVPVRCVLCAVLMWIEAGEMRLEEDEHVRPCRR